MSAARSSSLPSSSTTSWASWRRTSSSSADAGASDTRWRTTAPGQRAANAFASADLPTPGTPTTIVAGTWATISASRASSAARPTNRAKLVGRSDCVSTHVSYKRGPATTFPHSVYPRRMP